MNTTALHPSSSPTAHDHAAMTAGFRLRLELYARRHLGDVASVQDVVQATLEALLLAKVPFRGESSYQTYAIGILRHKIGDALRERQRYIQFDNAEGEDDSDEAESLGNPYFSSPDFTGPEQHAHSIALGLAIQQGLQSLSARSRQTFLMRERLGLDNDEIAAQLGLSKTNTWVLLCRAKAVLRNSLIGQGYGPQSARAQHA